MDDNNMKALWQAYDKKLEKSLALNLHCIQEIQTQKARSALKPLVIFKLAFIIFGIGWVGFVGMLVYYSLTWSKAFFVVSALIHILVSIIAIVVYIKHIILINRIDNSRTVVETQMNLVKLQSSTLQIVRLLFLQMPVFTTFFINAEVIGQGITFWIIQIPVTGFFTFLGIWLYRNISYRNIRKRWFMMLFRTPEWTYVVRAMRFMGEIEEFKKENAL